MAIVVVDGDRITLALVRRAVEPSGQDVVGIKDAGAALARLSADPPTLLVIAGRASGDDGIGLVRQARAIGGMADLPILMLTSAGERRVRRLAFAAGVTDFLTRPIDPTELRARTLALLRLSQAELRGRAGRSATEAAAAAEPRVADYARLIATQLGVPAGGSGWTLPKVAGSRHERWDGAGYPRGLAGEGIPLPARINAVADVFDTLVSPRGPKQAWSLAEARRHLAEQRGHHFDPTCVDALLARWDDVVAIAPGPGDGPAPARPDRRATAPMQL